MYGHVKYQNFFMRIMTHFKDFILENIAMQAKLEILVKQLFRKLILKDHEILESFESYFHQLYS